MSVISDKFQMMRLKKSQAGQGTVEYVLILVVTVSVILGALYQLNSAVSIFADAYFGEYLTCLLETGELPGLGGQTQGVCNQEYKEFSLSEGRPLVGQGVTTETGSDGTSNEPGQNMTARGYAAGNTGNRFYAGSSTAADFNNGGRPERFSAGKSSKSSSEDEGKDASSESSGVGTASISGYQEGKIVRIPIRRAENLRGGQRVKKKEDAPVKEKTAATQARSDEIMQRQALIPIKRVLSSEQKAPELMEFSFGNLFRYLIIALIIIAIIVVVGGEVQQVVKSVK